MCSEFRKSTKNIVPEDTPMGCPSTYPRLLHLRKSSSAEPYGFSHLGVTIAEVFENSPASRLGLKVADKIFEINGNYVFGSDGPTVSKIIRSVGVFEMKLLVLDDAAIEYYTKQNVKINGNMKGIVGLMTPDDEMFPYKSESLVNKIENLEKRFVRIDSKMSRLMVNTNSKQSNVQHSTNCLKNKLETPNPGEYALLNAGTKNTGAECDRDSCCNRESHLLISRIESLEEKLQNLVSLNEDEDGWIRVDNYKD